MGSCCRTAATDYASFVGKSLHSCWRRTGGQEPADPSVLLRGGREKPFGGFLSVFQMMLIVTGSLYPWYFFFVCVRVFTS